MILMQDERPPEGEPSSPETTAGSLTDNEIVANATEAVMGLFDGDVTAADLASVWQHVGIPVVKVVVLIVGAMVISRWIGRLVTSGAIKARIEITLARFFGNLARWAVLVLAVIAILQTFGVETTSFAAVIAGLTVGIGLAMSGTLSNVAAGIMLLIFRPYKVGDLISVAGVTGTVYEIELFTTTFDTPDNRRIIVPNSEIFGKTIENATYHPKRRVDVDVGTAYSADVDKTREVLIKAATNVKGRITEDEPVVYLKQLGGSSVDWAVRVWAPTADYWTVRERLTRDIKVALDEAGIGIPFPQMDVHLFKND